MTDRDPIAAALEDLRKREAAEPKIPDPNELVPYDDSEIPRVEAECLEFLKDKLKGREVRYTVKENHVIDLDLDNTGVTLAMLQQVTLPSRLELLGLVACDLTTLNGVKFPDTLKMLDLNFSRILHLGGAVLPDGLEILQLGGSQILGSMLKDATFPRSLKRLTFWECKNIQELDSRVSLPPKLELLDFDVSALNDIGDAVVFPDSLQLLGVAKTPFVAGPKLDAFKARLAKSNPWCQLRTS